MTRQSPFLVAGLDDALIREARAAAEIAVAATTSREEGGLGARLAAPAAFDAYTVAHLQEASARIQKALDAGLEAERR